METMCKMFSFSLKPVDWCRPGPVKNPIYPISEQDPAQDRLPGIPGNTNGWYCFFVFTTLHFLLQTLSLRPENVTTVKDSENESEPENQVQLNEQWTPPGSREESENSPTLRHINRAASSRSLFPPFHTLSHLFFMFCSILLQTLKTVPTERVQFGLVDRFAKAEH